jgi:hypothetical protein
MRLSGPRSRPIMTNKYSKFKNRHQALLLRYSVNSVEDNVEKNMETDLTMFREWRATYIHAINLLGKKTI